MKIEIINAVAMYTVESDLYGVTHGEISIADLNSGKRVFPLGDGSDYRVTDSELTFILTNQTGAKLETYSNPLLNSISKLTPKGKSLILPQEELSNYSEVKKTLVSCLGVYNRNKFDFPIDAEIIKTKILAGEIKNLKKELQFFGTPKKVAEEMTNQIIGMWEPNLKVLEPSAGQGSLIEQILEVRPHAQVTAVEINDINNAVLKSKFENNDQVILIEGDFLSLNDLGSFDLILANPPFTKGLDIAHIKHMYKFLKKGGQLIVLSSEGVTFNQQKQFEDFRNWVEDIGSYRKLDSGSFTESGTGCNVVLWEIRKYDDNEPEPITNLEIQYSLF